MVHAETTSSNRVGPAMLATTHLDVRSVDADTNVVAHFSLVARGLFR